MKRLRRSFKPALLWLLLTTVLLCLPGSAFPARNWFSILWLDKWAHLALFGMMVVLWCLAITSRWPEPARARRLFIIVALLSVGYGVLMEFVQAWFIPYRSFENADIAMDALGSVLGLGFCLRYLLVR